MYNIRDIENVQQIDTFESDLDEDMNFKNKEEFEWWNRLADAYQYLEDVDVRVVDKDWDYELESVISLADRVREGVEVSGYVKIFGSDHANLEIEPYVYLINVPFFDREGNEISFKEAKETYFGYELENGIWYDDTYLGYINNYIQEKAGTND